MVRGVDGDRMRNLAIISLILVAPLLSGCISPSDERANALAIAIPLAFLISGAWLLITGIYEDQPKRTD